MNLAITKGRSAVGVHAQPVSVEVHLSNGLPNFTIVGLPAVAVKESKDRVRSAILNSQFEFPCRRITVNLAPADVPKIGSGFDLPIAIGILAASGQIPKDHLSSHEFIAELALDGNLRGVPGIIPVVLAAHRDQQKVIVAATNAEEASLAHQGHVFTADHLRSVCAYLCNEQSLTQPPERPILLSEPTSLDWSDVKGQKHAKYALEIAASGGHSVLLNGPPGSGKTMLASRFQTLLPSLSEEQALECAAIRSLCGKMLNFQNWRQVPFRSPHHTASSVALIGGGNPPKPGEISLAHQGVLFLDELPEFNRHVLETLREPLESGSICISRAALQSEFPAQFQLIAAMNPCPCGQWGNNQGNCLCSPERIHRYLSKISDPLLDRIDLHVTIEALSEVELVKTKNVEVDESERIRDRVEKIREHQMKRQGCLNAHLSAKACEDVCDLGIQEEEFLASAMNRLKLSARAFHRLLKVARTIVDQREGNRVERTDLQQALSFRQILRGPGF
jgi:magnesium chelatase family protein